MQDGCLLDCGHSISMPADPLSLNFACLLTLCFSIWYTYWYGVPLSAVSVCMVSHYQLYLLVWCFITIHAFWFWFGTSLSAMPVGVVPHYRSYHLVWCLTVGHVFWCGASLYAMHVGVVSHYSLLVRFVLQPTFWLVECRRKRDGYKSHRFVKLISYHPGRHLEYIKFWVMH